MVSVVKCGCLPRTGQLLSNIPHVTPHVGMQWNSCGFAGVRVLLRSVKGLRVNQLLSLPCRGLPAVQCYAFGVTLDNR